ncbi:hypothetical protein C8A00DRAFT_38764, partial [Chaetomidium leptoderma]
MATPLIGMEEDQFLAIVRKAREQVKIENDTSFDTETMALMVACLNRHFRNGRVYFTLVDAPGLDMAAFPAQAHHEEVVIFHQHDYVWSVAYVNRRRNTVTLFDGISSNPACMGSDSQRVERLARLGAAVRGCLQNLGLPAETSFAESPLYSHGYDVFSASFCLQWAEAMYTDTIFSPNTCWSEHPAWDATPDSATSWPAIVGSGESDETWDSVLQHRVAWARSRFAALTGRQA